MKNQTCMNVLAMQCYAFVERLTVSLANKANTGFLIYHGKP
jgi:hypothetical protein